MKKHFGIIIALSLFAIQALLIPGTGMTWDEPSSFFFGRANLKFWLTGDRGYVTDYKNLDRFKTDPIAYVWGEDIYPPFPFVIASGFSAVLSEKLHLLNTIDAHHLGEVAIGAIGIGFFYYLLMELGFTPLVAGLTTGIYALYPTIFGQMRDDVKDIPLLSMFVITMYWFVKWAKQEIGDMGHGTRDKRQETGKPVVAVLFFVLSFGLALATKPTAVILVPIVVAWIILSTILRHRHAELGSASALTKTRILKHLPAIAALRRWQAGVQDDGRELVSQISKLSVLITLSVLIMVVAWPWLWDDPVGKLSSAWSFFKVVGYGMPLLYHGVMYQAGINVPKSYPFGILLLQTPLEITILAAIGTCAAAYRVIKKRDPWALLVLIWFWGAMARFYVPGVIIYARIRHFIDAMPAFFILTGYGLHSIESFVSRVFPHELWSKYYGVWMKKMKQKISHGAIIHNTNPIIHSPGTLLVLVLGFVIILHEAVVLSRLYPYEPSYFNALVGGAKGVADKKSFDIEYWAEGVKEAISYINSHATGARIYTCGLSHLANYYVKGGNRIASDGGAADYVILPNSPSFFGGALDFHAKNDTMVHVVARDGADMYFVYKHTSSAWWSCGYETETNVAQ